MIYAHQKRGFALLISVILTSVVLALGIALLDISYKQVLLSSSAKNSQYAFYNADSALECALYYDQKEGAFFFDSNYNSAIQCGNPAVTVANLQETQDATQRITTFDIPCGTDKSADVTIIKTSVNATHIYANGYSSCTASDLTRIQRGLKATY